MTGEEDDIENRRTAKFTDYVKTNKRNLIWDFALENSDKFAEFCQEQFILDEESK